jgi:CheY-like chemotaxis protein
MTIMRDEPSDEGGYLDIAVSSERLGDPDRAGDKNETRAGPYVLVSISDTGVGMDAETQKRIFEPFFSLNKRGKGTGLGLSMAHDFIYQTGGFIELQSRPQAGTTFHVYLPALEDGEGLDLWEKPQRSLVPGKGTVLVIDDEKQILAVAGETLKTCGYSVLLAHDGIEGIELFKTGKGSISAVLLDISMPYMSGHKVCEKLKEIQPSVKVLMSSGYADDERLKTALKMGASGFIQKPYTAEELSRSMDVLLKESPPVNLDPPRAPDPDGRGAS